MSSWPTKLQKASSGRPSFQVADCRGASPKDGSGVDQHFDRPV